MKNNFHVFLGATIGDAAARPLHWVYYQKKVEQYIKIIFHKGIKLHKYEYGYKTIIENVIC